MTIEGKKTDISGNDLDLAQLMDQIRKDAEKRKRESLRDGSSVFYKHLITQAFDVLLPSSTHANPLLPELRLQPFLQRQERYHIGELLGFHDETFVRNAYRAILRREPDDAGLAQYLGDLRSGHYSKIDILSSLRFSSEGRIANVPIAGLGRPATFRKLYRVPVFGYLLRLMVAIVRLPVLITNHRRLESHMAAQLDRVASHVNEAVNQLSSSQRELPDVRKQFDLMQEQIDLMKNTMRSEIDSLRRDLIAKLDERNTQPGAQFDLDKHHAAELDALRTRLEKQMDDLVERIQSAKLEMVQWETRLAALPGRANTPSSDRLQEKVSIDDSDEDHLLDAFYSSLEDGLRGTPDEIKADVKQYLTVLNDAGISSDILDVGCGRGEWLEVLRDAGFRARGIDYNRIQIQHCKQLSLDVIESEALTYLRSPADESLNAVTAFHFVEHLPIQTLVRFIDEVGRKLRPGGLLLVETPNPENLLVGSCNFYLDPTHQKPIPIPTMKLLLEARGFRCLQVMKLHPVPSVQIEVKDQLTSHVNHFLYGPMNYAVVARKPAPLPAKHPE
jgi:O-antigen chain-terminating methyltransferase